ncbi:MAG: ABC transporter ATP-binding protein [Xanthomonadales bacterium]|nr:ABC transporter ATP-binding protein [Xanthomonadales bacterium]
MEPVLAELRGIHKRYGSTIALTGVDLELRRGELLVLLGGNGAGKTTAIGILLGLLRADAGSVALCGGSPDQRAARAQVGAMLQTGGVPETLRVGELLDLFGSYYPAPLPVAEAARMAGVGDLLDRPYRKLSGGQQRRVQFGLAVVGRPALLVLDEPTVGLDIEARHGFWEGLRALVRAGTGVLLTTHWLEEAQALADRVAVLARGRVVAVDTLAGMQARGGERRVTCRTRLAPTQVAAWPGVSEVRTGDDGCLALMAADAEAVVRRLLERDPDLSDLEVRRSGLAERFLELTSEAA